MSAPEQRQFSINASVLRKIGITLFILSFIIPSNGDLLAPHPGESLRDRLLSIGDGFRIFIETPAIIFQHINLQSPAFFISAVLLWAWLANFTIFFRLPRWASLIVVVLPWLAFACWFGFAVRFIPFYFWALGITLVHLSTFFKPRTSATPKPMPPV